MRTAIITTLLGLLASTAAADTRLPRFPDLHGDRVVFTCAGDLWLAGTDGSNVRRLTSHPGQELFARFSPDGNHIAFTGQYDGGEQVYVVPVTGGEPKRLTWYPSEGPLIGKQSWDGIIGITNLGPLIDGGVVYVPQFATASAEGQWAIEGVGVEPDIEVDNPSEALLRGEDPQLERAIEEALQRLRSQPGTLPPRPADPVKTPGPGGR